MTLFTVIKDSEKDFLLYMKMSIIFTICVNFFDIILLSKPEFLSLRARLIDIYKEMSVSGSETLTVITFLSGLQLPNCCIERIELNFQNIFNSPPIECFRQILHKDRTD